MSTLTAASSEPKRMQCMEVWGGNHAVDTSVVMAGLDAWLYSRPHVESSAGGGSAGVGLDTGAGTGGGDIHYVSSCAAGMITRLLIADVCGHGAAVSEVALHLRQIMRRYINYHDQGRLIGDIDREFAQLKKSPGSFATAVAITFESPDNRFVLCNAGHPPPLRYDALKKKWEPIDRTAGAATAVGNIPLGIELQGTYEQVETHLNVGDLVLCYTDSLIEFRNAQGEVLGVQGLIDVLETLDETDPAGLIPSLLDRVETLHPRNLREDDVTALLFRPNGTQPHVALRSWLLVPYHLIRSRLVQFWESR